jgi:sodium-coupled neutral amino acid transporter 9
MMFEYTQPAAFVLRVAVFTLLFSTYPLVQYFLTSMLLLLFWNKRAITRKEEIILNITICIIPMLFTLFYPHIGTILGYVGAFTGFAIMYLLPVMVHLKRIKLKITNPLLAEAIDMNAFNMQTI